ncbi:MAG: terminase large subunit [Gammaproteobacteria bacterium]
MEWTTACPDWETRIVRRRPLVPCPPLFPQSAEQALKIYRQLRVVDVPGSPTMAELEREWLTSFVEAVFGAYDAQSGRRLITEFLLLVSKKNTKSTAAAAIMLTALILNWRMSAEFLVLAPTIEIANNSFYPARDMVRADEELSDLLHVQDHIRTITHRATQAVLKVVAADSETVSGKKATGVLVDELWLFGKRPNAENMLREATGGLASRPEGFTIYLSTQSDDPPAGVFLQKLRYARDVRDGKINDRQFMPVLYEFPQALLDAGAARKPENFYVTNPNLGVSVDPLFLDRELKKAENDGEESIRGFLAKHLNVEIGLSLRSNRWAGADFWTSCAGGVTLEGLIERSTVITVGIDGGGLDDMLAMAAIGLEAETGKWLHWTHAWVHPIVLERRKSEAERFRDFAKAGDLTIVENIGDDVQQVADYVEQIEASGLLDRIGVDQAGIGEIVEALLERKFDQERIVGIPQGWRMTAAIKTAERKLAEAAMLHQGCAMMSWCVGNAKVEPRGNAIIITKQASGTAKIDPLMATFDAVALMAMDPKPRKKKYQMFVGRI